MAGKRSGLGRGLESLFGESGVLQTPAPAEKPKTKTASKSSAKNGAANGSSKSLSRSSAAKKEEAIESVVYISLSDIKPNAAQPRKDFDEDALNELAASIKEHGLIQPVLVRPSSKGYELVAGERRWRAARLAGLKQIPAIVRDLDEKTNAFYALIENMQRENLNPMEEAEGIREIMEKYGLNQDETSKVVGKSRPYIANSLRLLKLPDEVKALVYEGRLSSGHARAVAGLGSAKLQIEAAGRAAKEGWSVRQIEKYSSAVSGKKASRRSSAKKKDAETKALEEKLSEAVGTKVVVEGSAKSGKIIIDYYSADELDRLIEMLK